MADAEKREKVIRGFEACNRQSYNGSDCQNCPYYDDEDTAELPFGICNIQDMFDDALALLKEQEARVIKEGELYRFQCKDVWIEKILSNYQHIVYAATLKVVSGYCIFHGMEYDETIKDYNVECAYGWRCWTARPTEEQMRETPWEGDADDT